MEVVRISLPISYEVARGQQLHTFGEDMSNRESWEFTFTGAEMLQAVKDQLSQLKHSLTETRKELAEAQKAVQKAGFNFEDGNSLGKGDYKLVTVVQTLRFKLESHERRQKDLHRWQVLMSKPDTEFTEYQIKFNDHMFFFPEQHEAIVKKPEPKAKAPAKAVKPKAPVVKAKTPPKVVEVVKVAPTN